MSAAFAAHAAETAAASAAAAAAAAAAPPPAEVVMDPGQEAEPASVDEIEALCNARKKAKKEKDGAAA